MTVIGLLVLLVGSQLLVTAPSSVVVRYPGKPRSKETISRSSAKVEYRSMGMAVSQAVWVKGLLSELCINTRFPVALYCDNKATIQITENPKYHERTKHIQIDCPFVRDKMQDGTISPIHLSKKGQIADILTKALPKAQHYRLLHKYGVLVLFLSGDVQQFCITESSRTEDVKDE